MTQASPGEASKVPEKTPQGVTEFADVAALVDGLLRPEAYPWRPTVVELVETHVSWVFLSGERVVKVKKPVDYGFVDHAALASRRRSCEDEVRLNRRLTDGVYLGVVPIVRDRSGHRVALTEDPTDTPVEWATLMRRLPAGGCSTRCSRQGLPRRISATGSATGWSRSTGTGRPPAGGPRTTWPRLRARSPPRT